MSTSSASKQMVINTRERAVSTDVNRLQAFLAAAAANVARGALGSTTEERSFGDFAINEAIGATPLVALIMNGALAEPQIGSDSLHITPSTAWVVYPDAAPSTDDSPVKLIEDPGVDPAFTAPLTLTPGHAVLYRIDVVECRPIVTVDETSNRDIYNPATGLFAPAAVDKVKSLRWEYRIRVGTAGAGYPGNAAGWLPLMVAIVPPLAATWDDVIDCYDVRPLASDLLGEPRPRDYRSSIIKADLQFVDGYFATNSGVTAAHEGREVGGIHNFGATRLRPVDPNAARIFDPASVAVYGGGGPAASFIHLYALFPYSLPRWARYSVAAAGSRYPLGFRGIMVWSFTPPTLANKPDVAIDLPTNLNFWLGSTIDGVRIASAITAGTDLHDFTMADDHVTVGNAIWNNSAANAAGTDPLWACTMIDDTTHPAAVRSVDFMFYSNWEVTAAAGANPAMVVETALVNNGSVDLFYAFGGVHTRASGIGAKHSTFIKETIPVPNGGLAFDVKCTFSSLFSVDASTGQFRISGFRI